jgi:hypothetical protein
MGAQIPVAESLWRLSFTRVGPQYGTCDAYILRWLPGFREICETLHLMNWNKLEVLLPLFLLAY